MWSSSFPSAETLSLFELPREWSQSGLPLRSIPAPFLIAFLYLAIIFGLQYRLKEAKPFNLRPLVALHNGFLSITSSLLLGLICLRVVPQIWQRDYWFATCSQQLLQDHTLFLCFYANYLFKIYELVDTVLLVLKKKELDFLHVYHHTMTLLLSYSQLEAPSTVVRPYN